MKELLKLVKVEFQKLKRKKFILLVTLAAFMFPLPLAYLMTTPAMMEQYIDKADKLIRPINYPKQTNEHNALSDARWNYELYKFLNRL